MRLAIAGSRGIPANYGGFETFVEEISRRLQEKGIEVTVVCQHSKPQTSNLNNVNLIYSNYRKAVNPLRFYYDSIRMVPDDTDVLLVCGVGGAVFYPFLKRKNCRLLTHVDGREELRGKYSVLKKIYVWLAQALAAKYSDHIVADSFAIRSHWMDRFNLPGKKISAIEFGANIPLEFEEGVLNNLCLVRNNYFLVVCRMVPENSLEMILKGFNKSERAMNLVLVGDTSDKFGRMIRKYSSDKVIFTGAIYEKHSLNVLRRDCFAYIHGHSVGGTNPSLLEAMAAGNICICHDNEFNRETTENNCFYFSDEKELAERLTLIAGLGIQEKERYAEIAKARILNYYNWERITDEYIKLFKSFDQ